MRLSPLPQKLFVPPTAISSAITFRQLQKQDKQRVYESCYAERPFLQFADHFQQMMAWQAEGRCCWLVAWEEPQIVGSGQLICYSHSAELANLSVAPIHRGQGIGTALIEILIGIAQNSRLSALEVGVALENERALKLYQRLGFAIDRQLRTPSALILRRPLS